MFSLLGLFCKSFVRLKSPDEETLPTPQSSTLGQPQTEHLLAKRRVTTQLIQVWMDRLQVLTIVTTFFATIDSGLLDMASSDPGKSLNQLPRISFAGALIFHMSAAIIAFTASFVLLHYRITEATRIHPTTGNASALHTPEILFFVEHVRTSPRKGHQVQHSDPGSEYSGPPLRLLTRCHTLCICMCAFGFVLALMGILSYTWMALSKVVGIFSSVCLFGCTIAGVIVIL